MSKIKAFTFTSKSLFSFSGASIRISSIKKEQKLRLLRQFEGQEEESLCEFNCIYPVNKLIKFNINSKNRDIYSLIKAVKSEAQQLIGEDNDFFKLLDNENPINSMLLKIWQENFHNKDFIKDSYTGYIFTDKLKNLWIYDVVPAIKEFSQVSESHPLPTPGTTVSYKIEDANTGKEIFFKNLIVPDFIPGSLELHHIFEKERYLYHIGLYHETRLLWSQFTYNSSKRRAKFIQDAPIAKNDLLSNIIPDINTLPNLKTTSNLFPIIDNPPMLSNTELMETTLKISKIKTDKEDPNKFNSITFETKDFNSSSFPRTLGFIYPYR